MLKSLHIVVWSHYYVYSVYHDKISNRRRKVLDTGEGGGGEGKVSEYWGEGAKRFSDYKLIGAPRPQLVSNNYISHIEN